nr:uncharacterized mitochondrial protein AtMg00810-like [Tanacetum cinerariifolium]
MTRDDLYSRRFDEYKEKFDSEIEQLANEYDLRVGRKKYALDDIWEKCEKFQDTAYRWHDEGFEEDKQFRIDSKSFNKVSVLVVLDLSKVANPLYSLRDKDLLKSKDPQVVERWVYILMVSFMGWARDYLGFLPIHVTDVKSASTPIETEKPLLKDPDGEDVDVHIYRYLKGKPHLGLWYPKDSLFNLVAYSDSDYTGASLDRKSTRKGCQFLGCRLISWQCKKQTVVTTSSTEAEYVAAASCCAQVLWIQNQLLDYGK